MLFPLKLVISSQTHAQSSRSIVHVSVVKGICLVYKNMRQQTISRTSRPNIGLFVLIMHISKYEQKNYYDSFFVLFCFVLFCFVCFFVCFFLIKFLTKRRCCLYLTTVSEELTGSFHSLVNHKVWQFGAWCIKLVIFQTSFPLFGFRLITFSLNKGIRNNIIKKCNRGQFCKFIKKLLNIPNPIIFMFLYNGNGGGSIWQWWR